MSAQAVNHAGAPGWFGKLPSLGDFASRRLPDDFVHGWDEWLQQGLASARDALGDDWLDRPNVRACRFWLGAGVVDASSWLGVMVPSRDRVDRRFPLTIAMPDAGLAAALASSAWFDAIERSARGIVDRSDAVEALERELARIAADAPLADGEDGAALASELLAQPTGSVWWNDGARRKSEFSCAAMLPPAGGFAALFTTRRMTSAA